MEILFEDALKSYKHLVDLLVYSNYKYNRSKYNIPIEEYKKIYGDKVYDMEKLYQIEKQMECENGTE